MLFYALTPILLLIYLAGRYAGLFQAYEKMYGKFEMLKAEQYPEDVLRDIYEKSVKILNSFSDVRLFMDDLISFISNYKVPNEHKDTDRLKRLLLNWAGVLGHMNTGFGLLLGTGYTPTQLYGGIKLLDKTKSENDVQFSEKFYVTVL